MISMKRSVDSFQTLDVLETTRGRINYYSLRKLAERLDLNLGRLPYSIKILLESLVRAESGKDVRKDDIIKLAKYDPKNPPASEIPFKPARVLLQDFTGVPCVVDLAAMRAAMADLGGDPQKINPQVPVDLVIDHSVSVDYYNSAEAMAENARLEFERNRERYEFLRWGQQFLQNLRIIPPASGICHQVNLEYLASVVQVAAVDKDSFAFPDSLVGTDSHTTMINGLGVLGWGVGGIEAEAVMLGQPTYMLAPEVIGFKLFGEIPRGVTATDIVLAITQILRKKGVVGKFVEFTGPGLAKMSVPDRATIANMAPEYGATMGFFPVDSQTLQFLKISGRAAETIELVEKYCKEQDLFRSDDAPEPEFKDIIELDLSTIKPGIAGPKRPQDRLNLSEVKANWRKNLAAPIEQQGFGLSQDAVGAKCAISARGETVELKNGDVVIAAITSCTNTSNPSVMIAAGLLAKKAVEHGLKSKPYVKTSLAPGSRVVTEYLSSSGLLPYLEKLGFYNVGYGCTTCIGNSGPLEESISQAIAQNKLVVASVLSGNRNFEGRVHPDTRANYLASPPLVVAYAIAGTIDIDLSTEPIGRNGGKEVFLKDIWPTEQEISEYLGKAISADVYNKTYANIEKANRLWNEIPLKGGALYEWNEASTYIQQPPFFKDMRKEPGKITPIKNARVLVKVGNSVTTDHISPAGSISQKSPAGQYLISLGISPKDFNSYGSRRGNDKIMTRGTFANIRLKNQLAPGTEGGWTTHFPSNEVISIYEASVRYKAENIPTIVLAGIDYGMGSSRDWAAKGPYLLGIKAVIAESFERIHRSNLVGMGILPLQFENGQNAAALGLSGKEVFQIDIDDNLKPLQKVSVSYTRDDGKKGRFDTICRIDTPIEIEYYRHGGILQFVLRNILNEQ